MNSCSRFTTALALLALAAAPLARAADDKKAPAFEEHRKEALAHIEKRIANLQTAHSCVQSAADGAALRKCHETLHESMKELREEGREERKERRAERQERRGERREHREHSREDHGE